MHNAGSWVWRGAHSFDHADMCEPVRDLPALICVLPVSPPPALIYKTLLNIVLVSVWVLNTSSEHERLKNLQIPHALEVANAWAPGAP